MNEKNPMQQPKRPPSQQSPPPPKVGLWRYLIWFFLIWIAFTYVLTLFGDRDRAEITYTQFKSYVSRGTVESVTIRGDRIEGRFENAQTIVTNADSTDFEIFTTTKPPFEDPELLALLEANNVVITAEVEQQSWLPYLLFLVPWLLVIGYFVYAGRRMQGQMRGGGDGLFGVGKSKAKRYKEASSNVKFDDVAGLDNAKKDLKEIIEYLKQPGKFSSLGAEVPRGILLMGPPGTGKTLLARATAGEAGVPFFSISGSEFIEMFVGVGASRVRDMFETAKNESPSIIFIDEIDSVGRARGTGLGGGHDEREQTLNQILSEMDGFEPHQSVVVMAGTNRPDVLDSALTRPGRFDRHITLDLPQKNARFEILKIHTREVPLSEDVDLTNIAARTVGFSGADLKNLVNEAALLAGSYDKKKVDANDFEMSRDKILLGSEREEKIDDEEKKVVAYHEAGHALLAVLLPNTDPLQKVTIIPRGRSLGATEQIPETDRYNVTRSYIYDRIIVSLGGRAAEKMVFGEMTNGAAEDLKNITQLARKMVCQWGMSDKIGPVTFRIGEEHMFLGKEISQARDFSEETARLIDEEIQSILFELEDRAINLLSGNREKLDAIAEGLLEFETLDKRDVDKLLEKFNIQSKKKDAEKRFRGKGEHVLSQSSSENGGNNSEDSTGTDLPERPKDRSDRITRK